MNRDAEVMKQKTFLILAVGGKRKPRRFVPPENKQLPARVGRFCHPRTPVTFTFATCAWVFFRVSDNRYQKTGTRVGVKQAYLTTLKQIYLLPEPVSYTYYLF